LLGSGLMCPLCTHATAALATCSGSAKHTCHSPHLRHPSVSLLRPGCRGCGRAWRPLQRKTLVWRATCGAASPLPHICLLHSCDSARPRPTTRSFVASTAPCNTQHSTLERACLSRRLAAHCGVIFSSYPVDSDAGRRGGALRRRRRRVGRRRLLGRRRRLCRSSCCRSKTPSTSFWSRYRRLDGG
jgi:hypothetical protein